MSLGAPLPGEPVSDSGLARATYRMTVEILAIALNVDAAWPWPDLSEEQREAWREEARRISRGEAHLD